ncbi:MAG: Uma2 family endonuclease [Bacteroidota bacterium]
MEILTQIPLTIEERLEYGEEMRIPATWEEFLDALEDCEYRIEYDENQIISFMGYATQAHETLMAKIVRLIGNLLNEDLFTVCGSNLALHIPGFVRRYYNADCTVIKGESQYVTLRGDMQAVANPVLIVEVLSMSTRDFDLGRKFRNYRSIPSLQQVLFIESTEMLVVSHIRSSGSNRWILEEFSKPGDQIPILGEGSISMKELYKKINV